MSYAAEFAESLLAGSAAEELRVGELVVEELALDAAVADMCRRPFGSKMPSRPGSQRRSRKGHLVTDLGVRASYPRPSRECQDLTEPARLAIGLAA